MKLHTILALLAVCVIASADAHLPPATNNYLNPEAEMSLEDHVVPEMSLTQLGTDSLWQDSSAEQVLLQKQGKKAAAKPASKQVAAALSKKPAVAKKVAAPAAKKPASKFAAARKVAAEVPKPPGLTMGDAKKFIDQIAGDAAEKVANKVIAKHASRAQKIKVQREAKKAATAKAKAAKASIEAAKHQEKVKDQEAKIAKIQADADAEYQKEKTKRQEHLAKQKQALAALRLKERKMDQADADKAAKEAKDLHQQAAAEDAKEKAKSEALAKKAAQGAKELEHWNSASKSSAMASAAQVKQKLDVKHQKQVKQKKKLKARYKDKLQTAKDAYQKSLDKISQEAKAAKAKQEDSQKNKNKPAVAKAAAAANVGDSPPPMPDIGNVDDVVKSLGHVVIPESGFVESLQAAPQTEQSMNDDDDEEDDTATDSEGPLVESMDKIKVDQLISKANRELHPSAASKVEQLLYRAQGTLLSVKPQPAATRLDEQPHELPEDRDAPVDIDLLAEKARGKAWKDDATSQRAAALERMLPTPSEIASTPGVVVSKNGGRVQVKRLHATLEQLGLW